MNMNRFVYADNAATTQVSDSVFDAMLPFLKEKYGNASSIYSIAHEAKFAIEDARKQVAEALGAQKNEIFFTSCGSESDNWAIKGAAQLGAAKGKKHIITTNFEHHAVLHTCEALAKEGFEITYLPVNEEGLITPQQVADAIREDTALVTIMYANNEIGTILPIPEIGAICREKNVLFHTDAVQAVGHVHINVAEQNIDLLSLSGHKIHAPKGAGALYIRKGVRIPNLIHGGGQEAGRRAGTENNAFIVALGQAITDATKDIDSKNAKVAKLRDKLIDGVVKTIPKVRVNGSMEHRLSGNANISFEGIEGESILLMLDMHGICASSGSACTSGSLDPSHVLLAIGLPHEKAHGSLRLSFGENNTEEDVDYILEVLPKIIQRLRDMSPVWQA
ncbi:cysteine desulfurase NifS [[Clostridium] methylpentosum DSM 5476]|uniref:Cysteine desulfurase IscS n=1 Tax=[Clostridium] methylpentosum DSM 5476 TaxID=537013 RepID=C0EAX4_9FIRM|nr:cysteine desulfurase NifS [[Clostridium] methylpentosum DSM 5476]MEE1492464.1 cysteine desulfurase NifS [Massilioclostridium sp.]